MATRGQSKYMTHMRAKAAAKHTVSGASGTMQRHESMEAKAKVNADKGKRGGDCNRTQCQRPHAWWYNKTMQAYYCGDCAGAINESCLTCDHIQSFPDKIYVLPPKAHVVLAKGGEYAVEITTADGTVSYQTEFVDQEAAHEWVEYFWSYADLRGDGSPPFHYSELPEKMERLKKRIDELSVSSEEHSVGRAQ